MSNLPELSEDTFTTEVIESDLPVLVDFGAVWCGPCKMLDPIVEEISGDFVGKLKVIHVDVDHNPNLAMQYNVMGVPTLILFTKGQPVERMTGYKPKKRILELFEPHLNG